MNGDKFTIKVDTSGCTSMIAGTAILGKDKVCDTWYYRDLRLESHRSYALVSEYGQGSMYLAYLLAGKVPFESVKILKDGKSVSSSELKAMSWNLEPSEGRYKSAVLRKEIEKALASGKSTETAETLMEKFLLTEERSDRKLKELSHERWRASAALGYAKGKRIFYAPYAASSFYAQMGKTGFLQVLKILTESGALVLLPVGSDRYLKQVVNGCISLDPEFISE